MEPDVEAVDGRHGGGETMPSPVADCRAVAAADDVSTVAIGRLAEVMASDYLKSQGWVILDRNVRTRAGELDLVARDGATLVAVEVKARRGNAFGDGLEAIDARKQRRLRSSLALWLAKADAPASLIRFDAVVVALGEDRVPVGLVHVRDVIGDGH
jgi:TIGR00252 family protein